ncbi:MAG: c-type cytochrome [Gemmatimonadetes bacterium]|nr:c-type cytochrome [Gemmatimonadota bacterium]
MLEHEYDGIREYDNPLPRWWLWIFYATIVFVPLYYVLPGRLGQNGGNVAEYEAEVAAYKATQPVAPPTISGERLLALSKDREALEEGREVFTKNCVVCHGVDGGGVIGPNLTDNAWIHGGTPSAIHNTVIVGVLAKGMPSWERLLKTEDLDHVVAYVISLQGTKPATPKAPEGVVDTVAAAPPADK